MPNSSPLVELITKKKLLVMLGAGGVGKTTSSIALAILAAKHGLRVGLLSIDPAKRLAAALGMPLGHKLEPIDFAFADDFRGSLAGAMLDQKQVFDAMVSRFAGDPSISSRIFANRLYQAVSERFAGAIEYMALARVQEMLDSSAYDLIVLDTPPDTHALDFIGRPNILANFSENKVMAWLIKPFHFASRFGAEKIFSVGERVMGGIAKVTGIKALTMVSEFMVLMQGVVDGFQASSERVKASLHAPSTAFFLVCTAGDSGTSAALSLNEKLVAMGHNCDGILVNRCLPAKVGDDLSHIAGLNDLGLTELITHLKARFEAQNRNIATLRSEMNQRSNRHPIICGVEEQEYALHDKEGIYQLARDLDHASCV